MIALSGLQWLAWVVGVVTVIGVAFGVFAYFRPKTPRLEPPNLKVVRVGGLGSGTGAPREHIKAQMSLVNDGNGTARHWQVTITKPQEPTVTIARLPHRGPKLVARSISWNQDAVTGEVPAGQDRLLPDWLWVEGPPGLGELRLPLAIQAEGMDDKAGWVVVKLASAGGPDVRFEL